MNDGEEELVGVDGFAEVEVLEVELRPRVPGWELPDGTNGLEGDLSSSLET